MDAKLDDKFEERPFWLNFPDSDPTDKEMHELLMRLMRGVNARSFSQLGNRVVIGPFAGMTIPSRMTSWDDGNSGTKLLGVYEQELHAAFDHAMWRRPEILVNVGCAEGYYAVGFLRRHPGLKVIGIDVLPEALSLCDEYAALNGVRDRLELRHGCESPEELRFSDDKRHRLYIIDVEGEEDHLIDLNKCPEMIHSDIIVECHDFIKSDLSCRISDRLSATHRVTLILPKMPDLDQFQFMRSYPTIMSVLVAVEKRPMPCCWLACWANTKGTSNG